MASPPIPPSLDHLTTRPFSFYPPILNFEHNEWLFRKATWSEILVVNCRTGVEIWISRRLSLAESPASSDPVLIVGLNRELEYKGGTVWPFQRRVIEMPTAAGGSPMASGAVPDRRASASVVGIRLESNDRRIFKLIAAALPVAVLLCLAALRLTQVGEVRQGVVFTTKDQQYLALTSRDDFFAVAQAGQASSASLAERVGRASVPRARLSGPQVHRHPDGQRPPGRPLHRDRGRELETRSLGGAALRRHHRLSASRPQTLLNSGPDTRPAQGAGCPPWGPAPRGRWCLSPNLRRGHPPGPQFRVC